MTTISALPPAPSRADPTNFRTKADALLGALDGFVSQANTVAGEVNANASTATTKATESAASAAESADSAALAASAASAAAATVGATAWVNGATYALNANAISQLNFQTYRKTTASSVTTIDPAQDQTNWTQLGASAPLPPVIAYQLGAL